MISFDERVAIVTGAGAGLGRSHALALAERGARVVVNDLGANLDGTGRSSAAAAAVVAEIEAAGGEAVANGANVADNDQVQALVADAMDRWGRVDILVNNAGVGTAVPATRETPEQFRSVIDVNLNGCYWMAQACGRVMQPGSSIINVSSVLGFMSAGLPQAAYASSKAAIIGLTRDLAQQWTGRKGIRVNAIAPGFFESEMTDQYPEGYLDQVMARVPAGRVGNPDEFTATVVFLASDAAGYVTGTTLPVDGGTLT